MLNRELIEALKQHLQAGHDEAHLREETLKAGYDEETFGEALTIARQELDTAQPAAPTAPPTAESVEQPLQQEAEPSAPIAPTPETVSSAVDTPGVFIDVKAFVKTTLSVARTHIAAGIMFVACLMLVSLAGGMLYGGLAMFAFTSGQTALALGLFFIMYVVSLVVGLVVGTAYLRSLLRRQAGVRFFGGLKWSLQNVWPVTVTGLFMQLAITGAIITCALLFGLLFGLLGELGLVLAVVLLVPVFFATTVYFAFSQHAMADERHVGVAALQLSIQLVNGRWWAIGLRFLVLMLAIIAVMLGIGIVVGIIAAIAMAAGLQLLAPIFAAIAMLLFLFLVVHLFAVGLVVLYESCRDTATNEALTVRGGKLRIALILLIALGALLMLFQLVSSVIAMQQTMQLLNGVAPFGGPTTQPPTINLPSLE